MVGKLVEKPKKQDELKAATRTTNGCVVTSRQGEKMGNGLIGVHPLLFWAIRNIGQTRPREALACVPECPKKQLSRKVPAYLAEHEHLFFL